MSRKPKTNQPQTVNEVQGRDLFQTPNYAVDLLIPFLPKGIGIVWECAAGEGKIAQRLYEKGIDVFTSDIKQSAIGRNAIINFLTDELPFVIHMEFLKATNVVIVTNPPFSLKQKFYEKCRSYNVPFALLIPADYSGWIIKAVNEDGAEKIIPTRRIDYITPNVLRRIHEGETWQHLEEIHRYGKSIPEWKEQHGFLWEEALDFCKGFLYESIYEAPKEMLHKYSSSDFHSMWLTWGFGLGKSETFVELSLEDKKNNI